MTDTPRLIDKIADLTSIRDAELLEFSLLKTLHSIIKPQKLELFKVGKDGKPLSEIHYGKNKCEVVTESIEITEEHQIAFQYLESTKHQEYKVHRDGHHLAVFHLFESHNFRVYLTVNTTDALSSLNAHMINGMLQIYRNFCGLLDESQRDELTGLANRTNFDGHIKRIYDLISSQDEALTKDGDQPDRFWLAMVDIDNFKNVNDTFGHLYGDEVLVRLSQTMQGLFRQNDLLFRHGGEEFLLITQCKNRQDAEKIFERLRSTVASQDFPQVGQITISIGVVEISENVFPVTLLDYADQALYFSKNNGRNKVTFFEDMLEAGAAKEELIPGGDIELF